MTTYLGKSCLPRFTLSAFRKLPSIYVFSYFGFGGGMWDLIASVPDHCLSFYFMDTKQKIVQCIISDLYFMVQWVFFFYFDLKNISGLLAKLNSGE